MTRLELEVMFKEQIDYFFSCGPAGKDRDNNYDPTRLIIMTFRNPTDDGVVELQISHNYRTRKIIFDILIKMDDGDYKTSFWASKIPYTEEEYFQESTVKDMYFSFEFYQYLDQVLSLRDV